MLTNVEACHSRLLCELNDDPNGLQALTPSHFLMLKPLLAPPSSSDATS